MWNIIVVFLYPSACHVLSFNIKYVDQTVEHTHTSKCCVFRKEAVNVSCRNAL